MRNHRAALLLVASSAGLMLTACGSDDDASADNTVTCDSLVSINAATQSDEPDPAAVTASMTAAVEAAPDDIAPTLTELQGGLEAAFSAPDGPSEEFLATYDEAISWVGDNCGLEKIEVTAKDYEFTGLDDEVESGTTFVDFTNDGTEQHEFVVVRINDDTTESVDELLALSEEEASTKTQFVGATFAPPGQSGSGIIEFGEPGRYVAVCFIPVGSVGDAEGDGAPHAMEGMTKEFTVT